MAQSALINYHDPKTLNESKKTILLNALNALNNALLALDKTKIPTFEELKNLSRFTQLKD